MLSCSFALVNSFAFIYIFFVMCIMLLDAIAMYILLSSYKGRNKGIN